MKIKITMTLFLALVLLAFSSFSPVYAYGYMTTEEVDKSLVLEKIGNQSFSQVSYQKVLELVEHFIEDTKGYQLTPNGYGWSSLGSDSKFTTDLLTGKEGCYHYAEFVSKTIYGSREAEEIIRFRQDGEDYTAAGLKAYFEKEGQAGEHIRFDDNHSLVYLSSDQEGIYTLQYYGVWDPPFLSYMSYDEVLDILKISGTELVLYNYDTNKNISLYKANTFPDSQVRTYTDIKSGAAPLRPIISSSIDQ